MHQSLSRSSDFDISWIEGSECMLAVVRNSMHGFRGVSTFFSRMRDSRCQTESISWALDLRDARKIPDELWNWVSASWYPQLVDEGLRRQALILPSAGPARAQWKSLQARSLVQESFASVPRAIMWLSTEYDQPPVRRRAPRTAAVPARS